VVGAKRKRCSTAKAVIAMAHPRNPQAHRLGKFATIASLLLLAGCKTISPDGGVNDVAEITSVAIHQDLVVRNEASAPAIEERLKILLARPLNADAAVQIALLRNAGLQAAFNELGLAETAMVAASLPPSPTISVARLSSVVELEVERKIVANIIALATLPARAEIAGERFKQAKLKAAEKVFSVAADARRTYYQAVASQQIVAFLEEAQSAAQSASELMRRLGRTGAVNKLDQARDQVFYAEITAQLAAARQNAASEREKLTRLLGLWGTEIRFRLVDSLPQLPSTVKSVPFIERDALLHRVDLQALRIDLDILAKSYELTNATRFVTIFELSGFRNTTKEADGFRYRTTGAEIEIQIPIFDLGETKVREAELTYRQALNRLQEKAVNVRSEARDAYRMYRSSYELAQHFQREIVPLRKIISDEMLLRYNAMQIDVFQLLTEARQRISANVSAIEAQRSFWLASVNLFTAIVGGSAGSAIASSSSSAPAGGNDAGGH
jgi:outer membrane protein TolC